MFTVVVVGVVASPSVATPARDPGNVTVAVAVPVSKGARRARFPGARLTAVPYATPLSGRGKSLWRAPTPSSPRMVTGSGVRFSNHHTAKGVSGNANRTVVTRVPLTAVTGVTSVVALRLVPGSATPYALLTVLGVGLGCTYTENASARPSM